MPSLLQSIRTTGVHNELAWDVELFIEQTDHYTVGTARELASTILSDMRDVQRVIQATAYKYTNHKSCRMTCTAADLEQAGKSVNYTEAESTHSRPVVTRQAVSRAIHVTYLWISIFG